MLERMVDTFVSGFVYPDILWYQVLLGIALGIAFGALWLCWRKSEVVAESTDEIE